MCWREVLSVIKKHKSTHSHYTHYTQNRNKGDHSAYSADSAVRSSKLFDSLKGSSNILYISPKSMFNSLGSSDVSIGTSQAFTFSQEQHRKFHLGEVPPNFTQEAICEKCGIVWLWFSGRVLGCPWCWNRIAGRPIPHPNKE